MMTFIGILKPIRNTRRKVKAMADKFSYEVERSEVESVMTMKFSDTEWETIQEEIDSIFYHYLWQDLPDIIRSLGIGTPEEIGQTE